MKVLVVTNDFPPRIGGINYYVAEIVRRFPAGSVTVFASTFPGSQEHDATYPHPVIRWPARHLLPTPKVRAAVHDLVRRSRPDVVVFGAYLPLGLMGNGIERASGVPYAAFTHGVEIAAAQAPPARWLLRRLGGTAVLATAVSAWAREQLAPFVRPRARLELLPSGIDPTTFRPDVPVDIIRERHALGKGPVICCVSRLIARKGQDQVIRALPRLAREWPGIRFLVVGGGLFERALRWLAVRHGVADRVIFTGRVPYEELPAYFRAGEIFVMPCRSRFGGLETEALGAVYLQASAVGRPCIGGRAGGAPDGVKDGVTGLVIDGRSVAAIDAAISDLLRHPDRARAMGEAGAAWVHRELTWDQLSTRFQSMLNSAIGVRSYFEAYSPEVGDTPPEKASK